MRRGTASFQMSYLALESSFERGEGDWGLGLKLWRRSFHSDSGPTPKEGQALEKHSGLEGSGCDQDAPENRDFPLWVIAPRGGAPHPGAVVLLHGLNERRWNKYLPWAHSLCCELGRPIVLFPIAFHMERAPLLWSEPRPMWRISRARQQAMPWLVASSFANAALSVRLQARPDRLLWSGYQTLLDLVRWIGQVDSGLEPLLKPGSRIDFFGYSIGALLAEILLMGDPSGRLQQSRTFNFCGGCLLAQAEPVAKEILDSAAARAIHRLFVEEWAWEKGFRTDLARVLSDDPFGRAFDLMIREDQYSQERTAQLRRIGERVSALALEQDSVIPAQAVQQTLAGTGARLARLDFPYPYNHVQPFALHEGGAKGVERAFEAVFSRAARWLEGS